MLEVIFIATEPNSAAGEPGSTATKSNSAGIKFIVALEPNVARVIDNPDCLGAPFDNPIPIEPVVATSKPEKDIELYVDWEMESLGLLKVRNKCKFSVLKSLMNWAGAQLKNQRLRSDRIEYANVIRIIGGLLPRRGEHFSILEA